jgi:hypothetical protein
VRPSLGLRSPGRARPGVVGLLPGRDGDPLLPVVDALGPGDEHVLVLEGRQGTFGLHVQQVTGLVRVEPAAFGPAPAGQRDDVVTGTVRAGQEVLLLVDPARLEAVLWPEGRTAPVEGLKDDGPTSTDKG